MGGGYFQFPLLVLRQKQDVLLLTDEQNETSTLSHIKLQEAQGRSDYKTKCEHDCFQALHLTKDGWRKKFYL